MRSKASLILIFISTLWAFAEAADNQNPLTEEYLQSLPEEEARSLLARDVFAAAEIQEELFELTLKMNLYQLFYAFDGNPSLADQVKAYQRDQGYPVTGEITMGQWRDMPKINVQPTPIVFPGISNTPIVNGNNDYVSVRGAWKMLSEGDSWPYNHVEYDCDKIDMTCRERYTAVNFPDREYYTFLPERRVLRIISWTEEQLIATTSGRCTAENITINFVTGETTSVETNNSVDGCEVFGIDITLAAPRVSVLQNDYDAKLSFENENREAINQHFSSEFVEKAGSLVPQ